MHRFDAVVFDLDGVLIDSEPLWRDAEVEVFGALGLGLTHADARQTMGLPIDEVVNYWYDRRPWDGPSPDEVLERLLDTMEERLRTEAEPCAGAHDAVDFFADAGLRLGLASSSHERLIVAALDRLELTKRFSTVRSAEHETRGKPHPDVYLSAARLLSADPTRCLAVEDSERGVDSAVAAGMTCIAVPEDPDAPDAGLARAHLVLESLEQLDDTVWARLDGSAAS